MNAKKLEGFITRIKLSVPPTDTVDEEGNVVPSITKLPLKAIVRIRIPLKRPVEEQKEVINNDEDDEGKYRVFTNEFFVIDGRAEEPSSKA